VQLPLMAARSRRRSVSNDIRGERETENRSAARARDCMRSLESGSTRRVGEWSWAGVRSLLALLLSGAAVANGRGLARAHHSDD
jgi:hypothetical protein